MGFRLIKWKLKTVLGAILIFVLTFATSAKNIFAACGQYEVDTALGCIPVEMDKFVGWLLPFVFGIAGGIAFLLMIYGFILLATSKGDQKAVQGAKETITSAIVGLLVSIFAVFILRLVLLGILKIPGVS